MLQNSLLSSNGVYDFESDAQYSYLDQESEICFLPRQRTTSPHARDEIAPHQKSQRQTSFIASRGPRDYKASRDLRRSNGFKKDTHSSQLQLKSSTLLAKSLAATKQKLRAEKQVNQEQSDMLRQMQA